MQTKLSREQRVAPGAVMPVVDSADCERAQ